MVVTVLIRCKQRVLITRVADGTLVAELTDWRPQRWTFTTGPLPRHLPVTRLDTPWVLLCI